MLPYRSFKSPRGSALIIGFAMIALLAALALSFSSRMTSDQMRTESDIAGIRAYELAQVANTLKIQQVWTEFKAQPTNKRVVWVGGDDTNHVAANAPNYQDTGWVQTTVDSTCTRIKVLSVYKHDWALVRFTTWAQVQDDTRGRAVLRKIQRVVRFELGPASAFDYAYFANNYASISGEKMSIYGSVGANGNVDLVGNPLIDGSIYASLNPDVGSLGTVNGAARSDNLADYKSMGRSNSLLRPTQPTADPEDKNKNGKLDPGEDSNGNGKLDNFGYVVGYDGTQAVKTMQNGEAMPDFSTLDYYRDLSQTFMRPSRPDLGEAGGASGGIVKQLSAPGLDPTNSANYTVLINGTYGFNGESGFTSDENNGAVTYTQLANKIDPSISEKNGNVALIGTAEQPLVILGPVVISNDLVIKGVTTGQGTFYTGRNTHVVGDMTYKDPPQWKQNDVHFDETAAANKMKDIVGFGVAGNIVFGDYTNADTNADQWNTVAGLITPPYTHKEYLGNAQTQGFNLLQLLAFLLNTLDGQNGYNNAMGWFDGNYMGLDGGKFYSSNGTVPFLGNGRAFYQSTFSKDYIHSIATANPQTVHGIFYTKHFFGGRLSNLKLYGAMIARDEAIVSDNNGTFYYDPRISKQEVSTYVNLFLPRTAALYVLVCKESNADDAAPSSPDW